MKFSSKVKKCGLSPMRKFHPYAVAAEAAGKKIYHLNIGQPDIEHPAPVFPGHPGLPPGRCWSTPPLPAFPCSSRPSRSTTTT